MIRSARRHVALAVPLALLGCGSEDVVERPAAIELTREAAGHFCQMIVLEHDGPKGQIFLEGFEAPLWFPSVRDAIAFTKLPEESKRITAIYVNDMARASNWDHPEPGTWVEAREAWFVIGSARTGGMGVAETVPFSIEDAARRFAEEHGGTIVRFDDISDSDVLG